MKQVLDKILKSISIVLSKYGYFWIWTAKKIAFFTKEQIEYRKQLKIDEAVRARFKPWFDMNGDKTLRVNYDLNEKSIVFDVGGYHGDWTAEIYSMYRSKVFVFEPVPDFAKSIKKRFEKNDDIKVFDFGLDKKNHEVRFANIEDASSLFKNTTNQITCQLRDIIEVIEENKLENIDLIKINIEGGEYDLLERLIESAFINKIKNIQVQFHDFVPNVEERMNQLHESLKKTHATTYQYKFVWENWKLK